MNLAQLPMKPRQIFSFIVKDEAVVITPKVDIVLLLATLQWESATLAAAPSHSLADDHANTSGGQSPPAAENPSASSPKDNSSSSLPAAGDAGSTVVTLHHSHPCQNTSLIGLGPAHLTSDVIICNLIWSVDNQVAFYIPLPSGGVYTLRRQGIFTVHIFGASIDDIRPPPEQEVPLRRAGVETSPNVASGSTLPIPIAFGNVQSLGSSSSNTPVGYTRGFGDSRPYPPQPSFPAAQPKSPQAAFNPHDSYIPSQPNPQLDFQTAPNAPKIAVSPAVSRMTNVTHFTPFSSSSTTVTRNAGPYSQATTPPSSPSGRISSVQQGKQRDAGSPYSRSTRDTSNREVVTKVIAAGDTQGPSVSFGSVATINFAIMDLNSRLVYSPQAASSTITVDMSDLSTPSGIRDAIHGMFIKEKRKANIPWEFAFGRDGSSAYNVPPKTDIRFECTLLGL